MFTPLLNVVVLGVTALVLWPCEPYGDWNVVVPALTSLMAIVVLALLAELIVLARHPSDPRDLVIEALFETYASATGVAVAADYPVDWRRSRSARVVLARGLVAASRGRWEELARAEPASAAPRIITSIVQRVAIAAVVVVAGLLLATRFGDVRVQDQLRGVPRGSGGIACADAVL